MVIFGLVSDIRMNLLLTTLCWRPFSGHLSRSSYVLFVKFIRQNHQQKQTHTHTKQKYARAPQNTEKNDNDNDNNNNNKTTIYKAH